MFLTSHIQNMMKFLTNFTHAGLWDAAFGKQVENLTWQHRLSSFTSISSRWIRSFLIPLELIEVKLDRRCCHVKFSTCFPKAASQSPACVKLVKNFIMFCI